MTARMIIGDVRKALESIPDGSVDLVLTSSPFFSLRSYLPSDHEDKGLEIGQEETPGDFIDTLLDVTEALARVLAPHGSLVWELGDTYAGSGGAGGDYDDGGLRDGQESFIGSSRKDVGALPKSLCLIPESYRWALVYGMNPFTGRKTEQWRVRNVVRWYRPNPPVGALGDKFRPATSDMVVACKSVQRYFDLDGVTKDGCPPLDTWQIPTQPYKGSHYAVWPEAICLQPIMAMCPERVCTQCGLPSRRIVEVEPSPNAGNYYHQGQNGGSSTGGTLRGNRVAKTLGWTDCGHDSWRLGMVLEPFAGSGTTLQVATGLGRDAIGIDLDSRNYDLIRARVGMFLQESVTV